MKLDELEIGQRFTFADDTTPCVYAGESPCGRWFAYWIEIRSCVNGANPFWSIEETADGEEEVICE